MQCTSRIRFCPVSATRARGIVAGRAKPRVAPSRAPPNAEPAQQEDSPYYASDPMPDYDNVFTD